LPSHWLDRLVSPLGQNKMVARRLLIKLAPQATIDASWKDEAEYVLSEAFH
jgi:hemolysin-activating ACP:hemolysin acyltransferase